MERTTKGICKNGNCKEYGRVKVIYEGEKFICSACGKLLETPKSSPIKIFLSLLGLLLFILILLVSIPSLLDTLSSLGDDINTTSNQPTVIEKDLNITKNTVQNNAKQTHHEQNLSTKTVNEKIMLDILTADKNITVSQDTKLTADEHYNKALQYLKDKDSLKAIEHFTEAGKQGNYNAQFRLGIIYLGENNKTEAKSWLEKAANGGKSDAQYALGVVYFEESDYQRGEKYLEQAANNGNTDAQLDLGISLFNRGAEERAKKWLKEASYNGNVKAKYVLGRLYQKDGNPKEAKSWYEKAAKLNHVESQYMLGKLFIDTGNEQAAIPWLKQASQQGHEKAQEMLDVLEGLNVSTTYYLVIQSNRYFSSEMMQKVNEYAQLGYNTSIYLTKDNIYGTAIQASSKTKLEHIKQALLEKRLIPDDSYISKGDNFVERVYPK